MSININSVIEKALKKIGSSEENILCRYLPSAKGGYMHHFTFEKLKNREPELLARLIDGHILSVSNPTPLHPNTRSARGSRKASPDVRLSQFDLQKLCALANRGGETEIAAKLAAKSRSLPQLRRELARSVRAGQALELHTVQAYNLCISSPGENV